MLKAVLFDLDDTLIDWHHVDLDWAARDAEMIKRVARRLQQANAHVIEDVMQVAADYRNRTLSEWEASRTSLIAPHMGRILIEALLAADVPSQHVDEITLLSACEWGAIPGITLFPDVPPVLDLLRANNICLGIVTNAHQPMWLRDFELEAFGLLEYFPQCRLSAADSGYLKPHPQIFRDALACTGSLPQETVFVGDNLVADIGGAQAAGMRAVLRINYDKVPHFDGVIEPDYRIRSLEELPAALDAWYPGWRA